MELPSILSQCSIDNATSETIEQKLEQNEKIIHIFFESLPHLNNNTNSTPTPTSFNNGTLSAKELLINKTANSSSMPAFPVERPQASPATTPTTPSSTVAPIIKLFAKQLLTLKLCNRSVHSHLYNRHPSLRIWLKLFSISQVTFERLAETYNFHDLYDKNEADLKVFLKSVANANDQDCIVICNGFYNLKTFYKTLEKNTNPIQQQQQYNSGLKPSLNDESNLNTPQSYLANVTTNTNSSPAPTTPSTNTSTSSILNTSNSNESQLSSPSNYSINNENNSTNNNTNEKQPDNGLILKPKNSESIDSSNLMPQIINSHKKLLEQRKSESDAHGHTIAQLLPPASVKNTELASNLITQNNSNQIAKALTFSPTIPIKSNTKKASGLKVTTPPPSRKLSTGSQFNNVINVSHQKQVAALHEAAKKAAAAAAAAVDSEQNINDDNQTIQRSSSHESHLRNKITQLPASSMLNTNNINKKTINTNNNSNKILNQNSNMNDYCGEHKLLSNSMANTPTTDLLNENGLLNSANGNKVNANKIYEIIRRSSIEGSDCSSRGPSGQASPINAQSPTRLTSGVKFTGVAGTGYAFLTDEYYKNNNLSIPKSPKQYRDHRWKNTFKVANCGVCNKKMIIGIKCKACKFRCHKECEKKCTQPCSSSIISNLPHVSSATANLSPCDSNSDLIIQNVQQQACNMSSSSSTTSSNVPSPAIANNTQVDDSNINNQHQQHSWPSGASKMARVANKIVQSINSVSTPKQSHKQLQPSAIESKNLPESRSDSSCNSSGPNSPNNYKNQLQQHSNKYSNQLPTQINGNNDKKSTSSSSSISSQFGGPGSGSKSKLAITNTISQSLTPIHSTTNSLSPNQSANINNECVEFFPPLNSPHPIITKTDESNEKTDPFYMRNGSFNDMRSSEDKTTKEVRESLTLALKKINNNLNVNENSETNSLKSSMYDNNEYETSEQDSNQLNFSQDLKQFNITYEEITDKVEIGRGRFGTVYKAHWHGPHAIKEIDFDENLTESSEELKSFKEEVLNLRKTRHTNLILFVGACMKPPKCAILMSLCRGVSLYKYIHLDAYSKPTFDWTIEIATQIAQGMGYLHNKQMIHKDLRSKNIFIDGCKAVIADFGLYSITRLGKKLKRKDLLPITKECVFYMAPELVRLLGNNEMETMFSQASDVFSFGTIWYELFCYEYPFSSNSTETVIYSIGNGLKNISPNIQIPKEFKTILLKCWSKDASNRPDFSRLLETFRAIPKRAKLFRSPSHPGHIGRSLETLHTPMNDLKN